MSDGAVAKIDGLACCCPSPRLLPSSVWNKHQNIFFKWKHPISPVSTLPNTIPKPKPALGDQTNRISIGQSPGTFRLGWCILGLHSGGQLQGGSVGPVDLFQQETNMFFKTVFLFVSWCCHSILFTYEPSSLAIYPLFYHPCFVYLKGHTQSEGHLVWFAFPSILYHHHLKPKKLRWDWHVFRSKHAFLGSISLRDCAAPWVRAPVSKWKPGWIPCGHLFLLMGKSSAMILLCPVLWKISNGLGWWLGCVSWRPPLQLGLYFQRASIIVGMSEKVWRSNGNYNAVFTKRMASTCICYTSHTPRSLPPWSPSCFKFLAWISHPLWIILNASVVRWAWPGESGMKLGLQIDVKKF